MAACLQYLGPKPPRTVDGSPRLTTFLGIAAQSGGLFLAVTKQTVDSARPQSRSPAGCVSPGCLTGNENRVSDGFVCGVAVLYVTPCSTVVYGKVLPIGSHGSWRVSPGARQGRDSLKPLRSKYLCVKKALLSRLTAEERVICKRYI